MFLTIKLYLNLNCMLMLNCIIWNRTIFYIETVFKLNWIVCKHNLYLYLTELAELDMLD